MKLLKYIILAVSLFLISCNNESNTNSLIGTWKIVEINNIDNNKSTYRTHLGSKLKLTQDSIFIQHENQDKDKIESHPYHKSNDTIKVTANSISSYIKIKKLSNDTLIVLTDDFVHIEAMLLKISNK